MTQLNDNYGRQFYYLRLSVTDLCNFRCSYCLPDGCDSSKGKSYLTPLEIKHAAIAFAELGIKKIRLTGGEPTIRKDFIDIVKAVSSVPGIETLALTTNAYRLKDYASDYFAAGLNAINISVDSLNPKTFYEVTKHDRLPQVLAGIKAAQIAGFKKIKVNAVLLKGVNDDQLDDFLSWIKDEPISIRFIELMRTGENKDYFLRHHLSAKVIQDKLLAMGWEAIERGVDAGPAVEMSHPDYKGRIGFIAPYAKHFCDSCNRLRLSSEGNFHLCLFGDSTYSLRSFLQTPEQKELLKEAILKYMPFKRASHFLQQGDYGITPHLASIGG